MVGNVFLTEDGKIFMERYHTFDDLEDVEMIKNEYKKFENVQRMYEALYPNETMPEEIARYGRQVNVTF